MDENEVRMMVDSVLSTVERKVWNEATPGCEDDLDRKAYVSAKPADFLKAVEKLIKDSVHANFCGKVKPVDKPTVVTYASRLARENNTRGWVALCLRDYLNEEK